ncbi:MAG: signal recognition particle receptor subunit alpha [Candidatus Diapherotrites archaeon]|uniref:Signal recognition particle 54 kDa protein n=1 Tax=Candidatus Iainarchaeum sp. TaxID=3101447 RepID=A0A8T4KSX9_9ARCH|nr:signal recognition particle receptor subunit alpha [Candidatus Diapherotrites archaeon]
MGLGEKLRGALERLRKSTFIDKELIAEVIKDLQRALIAGDVEVQLVLELSKKIESEAFRELPSGFDRRQHIIKITYDLLAEALGGAKAEIPQKPKRILLVGTFGHGKTTATAKIAKYYSKRGLKVGAICADTARPAAFEQLQQLSGKVKIPFYGNPKEKSAAAVVRQGLKELEKEKCDVIIVDSAGRSALDSELVREIREVSSAFRPEQTWLVLGADTGQIAGKQARAFHDAVGVNGIIITRMDGSAKGGGALAACRATNSNVYFIGTGEKTDDFEEFDATRYLSRIMGYGDLQALLEKAEEISSEGEISPEELMHREFNLETFYAQLKAMKKMGPLGKVMDMLGVGMQIPKDLLETSEQKLENFKIVMDSMTRQEKRNPEIVDRSRILRIAKGSGKKEEDVRELLKNYRRMREMFKQFKGIGEIKSMEDLQKGKMQKLFGKLAMKKKKFRIR